MQDATTENKLRLLMIYAILYPEKLEGDKATKLMQLAKLTPEDMKVVNNMKYLGGTSQNKKQSSGFSLKFNGGQKTKNAARKDRTGEEEESWQLFRFYPLVELRVCHKLTAKLRREVILGSTSFDDPPQYIEKVKLLSEKDIVKAIPKPHNW